MSEINISGNYNLFGNYEIRCSHPSLTHTIVAKAEKPRDAKIQFYKALKIHIDAVMKAFIKSFDTYSEFWEDYGHIKPYERKNMLDMIKAAKSSLKVRTRRSWFEDRLRSTAKMMRERNYLPTEKSKFYRKQLERIEFIEGCASIRFEGEVRKRSVF